VAGSDHRILIELVGKPKARAGMVPRAECAAARVFRAAHQIVRTLQIRHSGRGRNGAGFGGVESNDAIKPLGPIPLEVDANSKIQGDLPGELERVARIYRLVKILVGRFREIGRASCRERVWIWGV